MVSRTAVGGAGSWLRDKRIWIAAVFAAAGAGVILNWGWLAAAGLAPVVLVLLPCAAMCALGLCDAGKTRRQP